MKNVIFILARNTFIEIFGFRVHPPKIRDRFTKFCFNYAYDAFNRITNAIDNTDNYNLTGLSYDKNGNILGLTRKGHTDSGVTTFGPMAMDQLTYSYTGNQLQSVSDAGASTGFTDGNTMGSDYSYDTNGNMLKDLNKSIGTSGADGIIYNHLNLPTEVKFDDNNLKKITYFYDAMGTKLRKVVTDGSPKTTDYSGNYIYENGNLVQFFHPEGYIEPDGSGGYDYIYQYSDHLGNVRLSYRDINDDGSVDQSEILQERNYYPFGLEHKGYNSNISGVENDYKQFQGQEWTEDLGLNIHEWKYRISDPAIGRFWHIDPLAEEREWLSPYNFVQNNPINRIDPDGALDESIQQPLDRYKLLDNGTVEYYDNKGGDSVDYLMDKNGNETRLTDTSILPQLESQTMQESAYYDSDKMLTGNYAISKNNKETKNLFEWIASRDTNEWAYVKGRTDEGTYSFIGSYHVSDQAPSLRRAGGFGDFETLVNIHSHHGTALYDFQPSGSDIGGAQRERQRSPNAQFSIYSPLFTKDNYNKAIEGKFRTFNVPYKKLNYEPSKYIPY